MAEHVKKKMSTPLKVILIIVIILVAAPTLLFAGCVGTAFIFKDYGRVGGVELNITLDDGTQETIPSNEFKVKWEENEVAAQDKYQDATISFTDEVEEVNGPTNYNGIDMDGYVDTKYDIVVQYDNSDLDTIKQLAAGDSITVNGEVIYASVGGKLVIDATGSEASITKD